MDDDRQALLGLRMLIQPTISCQLSLKENQLGPITLNCFQATAIRTFWVIIGASTRGNNTLMNGADFCAHLGIKRICPSRVCEQRRHWKVTSLDRTTTRVEEAAAILLKYRGDYLSEAVGKGRSKLERINKIYCVFNIFAPEERATSRNVLIVD